MVNHEKAERALITAELEDVMSKIDFLEQQLIKVDHFIHFLLTKRLFGRVLT